MFPSQDNNITSTSNDIGQGVILSYDFEIGDFNMKDGKPIELTGLEALKVWIKKVLKTEKHKFKVYTNTDSQYAYGVTIRDYINNSNLPYNFKIAEIQREITESLMVNSSINSVTNFNFEREKRTLKITFTINTIYGVSDEEVIY